MRAPGEAGRLREPGDVAVRDDNSLGPSGRSGRVHHVRRLIRPARHLRCLGARLGLDQRGEDVLREDECRAGLPDDEVDARGWEAGVQRHIRTARLEDSEERDDEFGRPFHEDGDGRLGADSLPGEGVREPVGPLVDLPVRPGRAVLLYGDGVGGGPHLLGEQVGEGVNRGEFGAGGDGEEVPAFLVVQNIDLTERHLGVLGGDFEEPHPPADECADRLGVEQVGRVLDRADQPVRPPVLGVPLGEAEREVTAGGPGRDGLVAEGESGERELARGGVLEGQHHLEQGVVGEGAGRVDDLHEVLERHVLVGVGGQGGLPDPAEEFGECRVAGRVGAQDKGVDEEPDQVVEGLVGAPGDGAADRHVLAGAEPGEECGETGLQHHEHAGAVVGAQLAELAVEFGIHVQRELGATLGRGGGAGTVGGQRGLIRDARQCPLPVGELSGEAAVRVVGVAEQVLLPERVVGVLDREFGPIRRLAPAASGVRARQVAGERAHGPAVARDVVDDDQQDVRLGAEPEQVGAQGQFVGEVEAVRGGLGEESWELLLVGVEDGQRGAGVGQDALVRHAADVREDGPQAFVTVRHIMQCRLQGLAVETAGEAQGERHVVGGARALHAVQEPQAALGERQRYLFGPFGLDQRGPCGAGLVEAGGEGSRGGRLEQGPDVEFDAEGGADPGGEAGREE
ncbi:hypothetical protein a10_08573 [Streptomyces acidiscabies]|nr:hypothetical protein a10_08573 [Streptomyces acidiscabies]GAV45529.1 hypothetical protein Saa2_08520 [Streptomyces acidiscabies]